MMSNSSILITILIIGRDTSKQLKELLDSIESQKLRTKKHIDILYIDDCSDDNSIETFKLHKSKFPKQCLENSANLGRSVSRNRGIKSSKGKYIVFLNSNVKIIGTNFLQVYVNAISDGIDAGFGRVQYESKDKPFQKYLNHKYRGSNSATNHAVISPSICLFSNCIVKKSILEQVDFFDEKLVNYGGEETDLAYRVYRYTTTSLTHLSDAVILRTEHPGALDHARRLEQFGKKNFQFLNKDVQKIILPYGVYRQPTFLCYLIYLLLVIARLIFKYPLLIIGSRTTFRLLLGLYIYIGIYGFYISNNYVNEKERE